MAGKNHYTAAQFIKAIPGTGGIITAIAARVGCDWITAKKYLTEYPTITAVWEAEKESILDVSESVLSTNIQVAKRIQERAVKLAQEAEKDEDFKQAIIEYSKAIADTGDIKWLLSRKGKGRGFSDKLEVELTLKDLEQMTDDELRAIAES